MASPLSKISGPEGSDRSKVMIAVAIIAILASLGWLGYYLFGGGAPTAVIPVDNAQRFIGAVVMELDKHQSARPFVLVNFTASEDQTSVDVNGSVPTAADLNVIKAALESAEPKVPYTLNVRVGS